MEIDPDVVLATLDARKKIRAVIYQQIAEAARVHQPWDVGSFMNPNVLCRGCDPTDDGGPVLWTPEHVADMALGETA